MRKIDISDPAQLFDVSLSFAGEDRDFVRDVAKRLIEHGQLVFYDEYYQTDLLGKDLVTWLRRIYGDRSRHCAVFVSKHYSRKRWPNLVERQAILDRSTQLEDDYLIPIVLDSSWLDGLPSTIGYIDARELLPDVVANLINTKLGGGSLSNDESDLFWSLMNAPGIFGSFLLRFKEASRVFRGRYGGWRTWVEVLRMDGEKLETYGLCTCDVSNDEFEPWVEMVLTERGKRFRDYLRDRLFVPYSD
jgi:hypothetical protein